MNLVDTRLTRCTAVMTPADVGDRRLRTSRPDVQSRAWS